MMPFNWEGLPLEVRIKVASLLDARERLPLQLTSKSNYNLVSYCPIHLDSLTIKPFYRPVFCHAIFAQIACFKTPQNKEYQQEHLFEIENAPQQLLKHSKNWIKKLDLFMLSDLETFLRDLLAMIKKEKEENNKRIQFRVKEVEVSGMYQWEFVTEFLQYFDTNVLECIKLRFCQMPRDALTGLLAVEKLRRVPVALRMNVVLAEYAVEMIKNFRAIPRPDHTFFSLSSSEPLNPEIKENIFDLLDLSQSSRKSICRLRKCSKFHLNLVDSCPVFLKYVCIKPVVNGNQVHLTIGEESSSFGYLCDKNCDLDTAIQDFLLIFKHRKSKVEHLFICNYHHRTYTEGINDIITEILSGISSKFPGDFKLKIKKLKFQNYTKIDEIKFSNLFKKLDSSTFTFLSLHNFSIHTHELFEEIMKSKQWKSLKSVEISDWARIPIGWFLRTDNFDLMYKSLSGKDLWRCIQKYLFKPFPLLTFFRISTYEVLPLAEIFAQFDVPAKNEPLETTYVNNLYKHTQRFELPWSKEYLFVVRIGLRVIKGVVCRKTDLLDDFDAMDDL
ncbi:hypothetical protein CAEBREN_17508 [Caenorhabditis brenneri]|uniref:F-box domain-containing protein n=1 Tax=Caenorhabditis brenneri TaxID=135651 RepID=G0M9J2_CAEBE|nr:hypothetical protein CAEBREN_17508 [Caenorhabditis brenneri]